MKVKRTNSKILFGIYFLLVILVLQTTSACAADKIWSEKNKGTAAAVKSDDITKAKGAFVTLAKDLNPTVVNISTTQTIKMRGGYSDDMFHFFEEFMGRGRGYNIPIPRAEQKVAALGSGVIVNKNGYIVTNNHVVKDADKIKIKLYDGKEYDAKIIGTDPDTDIALIKIDSKKDLAVAPLGDSSKTEVGEWVIAIGNPIGQSNTVTAGIVSAKGRLVPDVNAYNDFIQTDAAINPGNSGGPLINTNGEVIGINTAISRGINGIPIEGMGFAIPINNVKQAIQQLSNGGKISHKYGWLGVGLGELTPAVAESLKLKDSDTGGALVTDVVQKSPAQKAGIKTYDVITEFDGKSVEGAADLSIMIKQADTSKTHIFKIFRDKKTITINLKLDEKAGSEIAKLAGKDEKEKDKKQNIEKKSGISVETITQNTIKEYKLNEAKPGEGVYVTSIDDDSYASMAGVIQGDIILEVNREKISSDKDFYKNFKEKGNNLLKIKRGNSIIVIAFSFTGNK